MSRVVAMVDDLFFGAKMLETAKQVGVELKMVQTADALAAEALAGEPPALVIVDLNARQAPLGAIEKLRAAALQAPVIAFLSHVQVDLAEQARALGCDQVMPRSQFTKRLTEIFLRAKC